MQASRPEKPRGAEEAAKRGVARGTRPCRGRELPHAQGPRGVRACVLSRSLIGTVQPRTARVRPPFADLGTRRSHRD